MKQKIIILIIATIFLNIFLSGCGEEIPKADDSKITQEGTTSVVESNNQFALELYNEVKDEEGNIFFSPWSISSALAMTYEGARGKTADEIQSVFHFPKEDYVRRSSFANVINRINEEDKSYELHTANALWAQKDYPFLNEYFNIIQSYYLGKITNLDFIGETETSRQTINNWVEEQTKNKIKDLIPEGALNQLTRLVLTNAIYFKGTWLKQFEEKNTREENFRVSSDKTVKVPMMGMTGDEARFNYAETEKLQILEMPYDGEELSMLILLPKEDGLKVLEEELSMEKLASWKNLLHEIKIDVYIPKFKFETKYFLAKILEKMGMPIAFSMGADFSGMDGTRDLFISKIIHQAFVEVNEEGTEAAAATAVIMGLKGIITPTIFRADHPFIFIIQEKETGNILFLGRVVDPSQ